MRQFFFISILGVLAILGIYSMGIAAEPCPAGASCSENYELRSNTAVNPIPGQIEGFNGSSTSPKIKRAKKIELVTFSEILNRTPNGALYNAQKQAREWLDKQNPETIISYSETVTCNRPGSCNAFATVIYWRMVMEPLPLPAPEKK